MEDLLRGLRAGAARLAARARGEPSETAEQKHPSHMPKH